MGDEDHGSIVGIEGAGDDGDMPEINVIGGLVEDEQAGAQKDEAGEGDETLLPF